MALSGTIYSGNFGNNSFRLKLTWSATQNVSANTSTITAKLYLESLQSWASFSDGTSSAVNINIDGSNSSGSANSSISGNQSKHIYTHTRTVGHASDGTKSLTISAGHTIDISYSGSTIGSRSLSGTINLNTIARTSTVGIQGSSSAPMGQSNGIFIKINRNSSSFTHTLRYAFGSKTGTIANKITWVDHEWTIPADFATEVTNSTSNWGRIICDTYNGNTKIGSSEVRFTATVPSNANYNPTITTPVFAEANSAVTTAVGNYYIQRNSRVKMTATGGTKYGATITSIVFTVKASNHTGSISGSTATAYSSPIESGTHSVKVTITDSRGRQNSATSSFNVTAYSPPKITSFKAFRLESPTTTIQVLGTASMTAIGTANTVTMRLSKSPKGRNMWVVDKTVTATSGTTLTTEEYGITDMAITDSFDIKLDVWDELTPNSSTQIISVGTAIFPMSWGKTGIGVGTVFNPTGSALQVIGGASIDEYVSQIIPAGANLNNYTKTGVYYNPSSADTAKISNTPTNMAFSLEVTKHAGVSQVFIEYMDRNPKIFHRNMYNGVWGAWGIVYYDSGWAGLSYMNGFARSTSEAGNLRVRRVNNTIYLNGGFRGVATRGDIQMSLLPPDFRPNYQVRFGVGGLHGSAYPENNSASMIITSDGKIIVGATTANNVNFLVDGVSFSVE